MGWMIVTGPCFGCGLLFGYNPHRVPSIRVNSAGKPDPAGNRKPICRNCVERVNPQREANGLDPIEIHADSYEPTEVA